MRSVASSQSARTAGSSPEAGGAARPGASTAGISLIEVVLAMGLTSIVLLSTAPLIGLAVYANHASKDLTLCTALARAKIDELRNISFSVTPGGSLDTDIPGFSNTHDVDADGVVDYTRRWEITDLGPTKQISIRVISSLDTMGPAKEATIVTLVAQ